VNVLRKASIIGFFAVVIVLLSVGIVLLNSDSTPDSFYVGVTYCGESPEEAKQLIDRVKEYTNLFVLQTGMLQIAPSKINEIGDYAVSSGMYFMVYFGNQHQAQLEKWLDTGEGRWKDRFLGVYYGDEPAGKMLDGSVLLETEIQIPIDIGSGMENETTMSYSIMKGPGSVSVLRPDGAYVNYFDNGKITVSYGNGTLLEYETNGSIRMLVPPDDMPSIEDPLNGTEVATNMTYQPVVIPVDPSQVESYQDLMNAHPFPTYEATTNFFIDDLQGKLKYLHNESITAFTSDYVLYWFDYKAGYDVVMAQIGWNHTIEQDIALVRGAANMQNKDWGVIITWKYNNPPYLDTGEAIYNQMRMAYEAGAEYVVLFNYAENMTGPYGTLQEEHFVNLERFWNEVVQNPDVKQGSIEAEAVLVLPGNYGWGMRDLNDKIWGLWGPDEKSSQIWEISRTLLGQYGLSLDIIYEDSQFPVEGKYSKIFYWN
jgi:hypothetical protein